MIRVTRILVLLFALGCQGAAAGGNSLLVIGNPQVSQGPINPHELAIIYLRRRAVWPNGQPIVPVNQALGSAIRRRFSHLVFNQPPAALADYWNRMHFQGVHPPIVMASDRAVAAFVRKVPGAIGYVDVNTPTDGTKILGHLR